MSDKVLVSKYLTHEQVQNIERGMLSFGVNCGPTIIRAIFSAALRETEAEPEPVSADHIPDAGKMVVSAEPVAEIIQNVIGVDIGFIHPKYAELPVGTKLYARPPAQEWVKCSDVIRVKSLLRMLWSKYDAGGISMGRSYESVVLEAALSLLEDVENEDIFDKGDLLNETRSHLSKKMLEKLGLPSPPE